MEIFFVCSYTALDLVEANPQRVTDWDATDLLRKSSLVVTELYGQTGRSLGQAQDGVKKKKSKYEWQLVI